MQLDESCGLWCVGLIRTPYTDIGDKGSPINRKYLSAGQPDRAGPKPGEIIPEDALKLRRPGTIPRGSSGALLGHASAALGQGLLGCHSTSFISGLEGGQLAQGPMSPCHYLVLLHLR